MEDFVFWYKLLKKLFQICLTPWKNNYGYSIIQLPIALNHFLKVSYSNVKTMFGRDVRKSILSGENFQIYSFSWKKDLLKHFLNLFIQQMKDFWRTTCRDAQYNCSSSSKNNPGQTFLILPKNTSTRKAWIPAINRKEGTLLKNVYFMLRSFWRSLFW